MVTLEELCICKVITILCNNKTLLQTILNCPYDTDLFYKCHLKNRTEFKIVEIQAKEHILRLTCSPIIIENLNNLLWPVCYKILQWNEIYMPHFKKKIVPFFYWRHPLRINNIKTALAILARKNVSTVDRFKLACSVCVLREIKEIWKELSAKEKKVIFNVYKDKKNKLVIFFVNILSGVGNNDEHLHAAISYAAEEGLLEASKFLFEIASNNMHELMAYNCVIKLSDKITEENFWEEDEFEIGRFIIKYVKKIQNSTESSDFIMLMKLLQLFQNSEHEQFLNLFQQLVNALPNDFIGAIIGIIFFSYHLEFSKEGNYHKLFIDALKIIPISIREVVINEELPAKTLCLLVQHSFSSFLTEDGFEKFSSFIFNSSRQSFNFDKDKWEILHFIIQEDIVTIPQLMFKKEEILSYLNISEPNQAPVWNRILWIAKKIKSKNY